MDPFTNPFADKPPSPPLPLTGGAADWVTFENPFQQLKLSSSNPDGSTFTAAAQDEEDLNTGQQPPRPSPPPPLPPRQVLDPREL